jgi:hypothetical protein
VDIDVNGYDAGDEFFIETVTLKSFDGIAPKLQEAFAMVLDPRSGEKSPYSEF